MYDPRVGRWISEDPLGFAAGDSNLNRYVGNGVVNYVDPSGLDYTVINRGLADPWAFYRVWQPAGWRGKEKTLGHITFHPLSVKSKQVALLLAKHYDREGVYFGTIHVPRNPGTTFFARKQLDLILKRLYDSKEKGGCKVVYGSPPQTNSFGPEGERYYQAETETFFDKIIERPTGVVIRDALAAIIARTYTGTQPVEADDAGDDPRAPYSPRRSKRAHLETPQNQEARGVRDPRKAHDRMLRRGAGASGLQATHAALHETLNGLNKVRVKVAAQKGVFYVIVIRLNHAGKEIGSLPKKSYHGHEGLVVGADWIFSDWLDGDARMVCDED